ncbi:MAG: PepSY domain-containing protein [Pseudohongiella sp.]|nr:PepSY domain-containing protein [Pseudohongiella sp.]MDP2284358.1 PepSY domain-containing protein [Pseudohongiella sp.]
MAILSVAASRVLADQDCNDPIADWQPREVLRTLLEAKGWKVRRIRVEDGCYEVRALDELGRRVEASYSPATLELVELEIEDDDHERRESREHHDPSR